MRTAIAGRGVASIGGTFGQAGPRSGPEAPFGGPGEDGGVPLRGLAEVVGVDAPRHAGVGMPGQLRGRGGVEFEADPAS